MAEGTLVTSGSSGSMPTGSGSERLCRASIHNLNSDWQKILEGVPGHIYTILSITFCDDQGASGSISMRITCGSNNIMILTGALHGEDETYVWNDKFVIEEDDDLAVYNSVTGGHWGGSYIDQNWI